MLGKLLLILSSSEKHYCIHKQIVKKCYLIFAVLYMELEKFWLHNTDEYKIKQKNN